MRIQIERLIQDFKNSETAVLNLQAYETVQSQMIHVVNKGILSMMLHLSTSNEIVIESVVRSIPSKFIILDKKPYLMILKEISTKILKKPFILGETPHLLDKRRQWILIKHFFSRLATPYLQAFESSGIYSRWCYYEIVLLTYESLKAVHVAVNHTIGRGNLIAQALGLPTHEKQEPTRISYQFISQFGKFFFSFLGISTGFFVFEQLWTRCLSLQWSNYCRKSKTKILFLS